MLRELAFSPALDAYAPLIGPRDFAIVLAVMTAILSVLVVMAVDSCIESYRRGRALRDCALMSSEGEDR